MPPETKPPAEEAPPFPFSRVVAVNPTDEEHAALMRAAGWRNPAGVVGGQIVLLSYANGHEEWVTVRKVYKNGSIGTAGRGNVRLRSLWEKA